MVELKLGSDIPGLLVSVRSAEEAAAALAGGADVIDIKEPNRGSLGAAVPEVLADVVRAVAGRAMVTAALGELVELVDDRLTDSLPMLPAGISLYKIGLAGVGHRPNWQAHWRSAIESIQLQAQSPKPLPVAVVYADWRSARSPEPEIILKAAVEARCPALLVDTWDKSAGGLFDHWDEAELTTFISQVRVAGMAVVLAGSLVGSNIQRAAALRPDLIAVRTAACSGDRQSAVSADRVRGVKRSLGEVQSVAANV